MGLAPKAPDWPPIAAEEAARVLPLFPRAGAFRAIAWHSPRPFSAAARIGTDAEDLFLKRHHRRLRSVSDLGEEHRLIARLRARGMPVAEVLTTESGSGVASLGEWNYELHRTGKGADLYRDRLSWTPFLSRKHAVAAGEALARMHRALEGYDAPPRRTRLLIGCDRLLREADPLAALRAELPDRPGLARFLAERDRAGGDRERDVARVLAPFHAAARRVLLAAPPLWSHGDWHGSNLLWSEEGDVATILDFGLSDRTSALFDLATAIERSTVSWLDMESGKEPVCDLDQTDALLEGYRRALPLDAGMLNALADLLPLVHFDFALGEIDYFSALLEDDAQAALAYAYLVDHARWFTRAEGRRALIHLRSVAGNMT